jgi:hypothetical protein
MDTIYCEFCGLPAQTRKHHIIPRCKNGKETVPACQTCESFIHHTWSHNELRDTFNSVAKIVAAPEFQKFLKWRLKQDATTIFQSDRNKNRSKGKYK